MQSICLCSIALVTSEISFKHTVLGFALHTCCSEQSRLQKESLKYNLLYTNHVSVLEFYIVRISMKFKPTTGSKIKSLALGGTAGSVTLCVPNLVVCVYIFLTMLQHLKIMSFGTFCYTNKSIVDPSSKDSLTGEIQLEVSPGSQHLFSMGFVIHPFEFVQAQFA